jgi:putative membrane protein
MTLKNILAFLSLLILSLSVALAVGTTSDEQITKILTTSNDGEIALGKLAEKKAESKNVKKFAKEMVKDHSKHNKHTNKLSKKMDMKSEDSARASVLKEESDKQMAELEKLSGKEFDKAYMNAQIEAHQKTLTDLDQTLIPSAKNKKLKKELEKTRKTVAEHLDDAKEIAQKL